MKFSAQLRRLREAANLTQEQVANAIGVSLRTYKNYEAGSTYPRFTRIYERIAHFYKIQPEQLYNQEDRFLSDVQAIYGTSGRHQAEAVLQQFNALFAGGTLSEDERDQVMQQIQNIYWETKTLNKRNGDNKGR